MKTVVAGKKFIHLCGGDADGVDFNVDDYPVSDYFTLYEKLTRANESYVHVHHYRRRVPAQDVFDFVHEECLLAYNPDMFCGLCVKGSRT